MSEDDEKLQQLEELAKSVGGFQALWDKIKKDKNLRERVQTLSGDNFNAINVLEMTVSLSGGIVSWPRVKPKNFPTKDPKLGSEDD